MFKIFHYTNIHIWRYTNNPHTVTTLWVLFIWAWFGAEFLRAVYLVVSLGLILGSQRKSSSGPFTEPLGEFRVSYCSCLFFQRLLLICLYSFTLSLQSSILRKMRWVVSCFLRNLGAMIVCAFLEMPFFSVSSCLLTKGCLSGCWELWHCRSCWRSGTFCIFSSK